MKTLLHLDKVDAFYGAAHILHRMSLEVKEGERVALIGRNGVGKTTVVNTVLGLAAMKGGAIYMDGKQVARPRTYMAAQRGIAVVPQGRCIVANLTVEENLHLGVAVGRKGPWSVPEIYKLFPILQERAHTPDSALMANPSLILLDEPTEGLAPVIVDQLGVIFNQVANQGTALLLIEQNMTLVTRVATRYVAMVKGSTIAQGDVDVQSLDELHAHVMV